MTASTKARRRRTELTATGERFFAPNLEARTRMFGRVRLLRLFGFFLMLKTRRDRRMLLLMFSVYETLSA